MPSPPRPPAADLEEGQRDKLVSFKRKGEAALRNSGLGYTIVRPGPLVEEAGGYKALVFDQGNRISQAISCADVADVCLKALHNPEARNKTFEVRRGALGLAGWGDGLAALPAYGLRPRRALAANHHVPVPPT